MKRLPPRRKVLFAVQMSPASRVWTLTLDCGHAVQRPEKREHVGCETCAKDPVWKNVTTGGGFK